MFTPPLFQYLLVDDWDKDQVTPSPFQQFRSNFLLVAPTLEAILRLPTSIIDLVGSHAQRIQGRIQGLTRFSVGFVHIDQLPNLPMPPFPVVVSTERSDAVVRAWRAATADPVLHLPTHAVAGDVALADVTLDHFREWFEAIVSRLEAQDSWAAREIKETVAEIQSRADGERVLPTSVAPSEGGVFVLSNHVAIAAVGLLDQKELTARGNSPDVDIEARRYLINT